MEQQPVDAFLSDYQNSTVIQVLSTFHSELFCPPKLKLMPYSIPLNMVAIILADPVLSEADLARCGMVCKNWRRLVYTHTTIQTKYEAIPHPGHIFYTSYKCSFRLPPPSAQSLIQNFKLSHDAKCSTPFCDAFAFVGRWIAECRNLKKLEVYSQNSSTRRSCGHDEPVSGFVNFLTTFKLTTDCLSKSVADSLTDFCLYHNGRGWGTKDAEQVALTLFSLLNSFTHLKLLRCDFRWTSDIPITVRDNYSLTSNITSLDLSGHFRHICSNFKTFTDNSTHDIDFFTHLVVASAPNLQTLSLTDCALWTITHVIELRIVLPKLLFLHLSIGGSSRKRGRSDERCDWEEDDHRHSVYTCVFPLDSCDLSLAALLWPNLQSFSFTSVLNLPPNLNVLFKVLPSSTSTIILRVAEDNQAIEAEEAWEEVTSDLITFIAQKSKVSPLQSLFVNSELLTEVLILSCEEYGVALRRVTD